MFDDLLVLLKNQELFEGFLHYFLLIALLILFLFRFLIRSKEGIRFLTISAYLILIIYVSLISGSAFISGDYSRIWGLGGYFIFFYGISTVPKFLKWYDGKIDKWN
ncbi:hypothetical protein NHF50_00470 [Flavobacterium sp. NRK F10]|uniref:hypothetical protein n=1 Tax=Flavobacterium sp. NRK F10 TaxID=2954931 RepID=UPI0020907677|nr:hypothetical protein [Flavobacterium sp. NRK F10]MCO6173509.1 hypothetical protein [Flavobacterium sp. NRK F10]